MTFLLALEALFRLELSLILIAIPSFWALPGEMSFFLTFKACIFVASIVLIVPWGSIVASIIVTVLGPSEVHSDRLPIELSAVASK